MRLIFWLFIGLVAAVLALFAASNREAVTLSLWPLGLTAEMPLYAAILVAFLAGFTVGAAAAWNAGRRWRREARRRRRRITALEHELAATQAQLSGAETGRPAAISGATATAIPAPGQRAA